MIMLSKCPLFAQSGHSAFFIVDRATRILLQILHRCLRAGKIGSVWLKQFTLTFPEYRSDEKIAHLLSLHSKIGGRRIRAFRNGDQPIPYGLWRRFLELTGRVNQEITPVLGFFAD